MMPASSFSQPIQTSAPGTSPPFSPSCRAPPQVVCGRTAGRAVRLVGAPEAERRNESARLRDGGGALHPLFALDDYRDATLLLRGARSFVTAL
jgi:hypothetical protein